MQKWAFFLILAKPLMMHNTMLFYSQIESWFVERFCRKTLSQSKGCIDRSFQAETSIFWPSLLYYWNYIAHISLILSTFRLRLMKNHLSIDLINVLICFIFLLIVYIYLHNFNIILEWINFSNYEICVLYILKT